MEKTNELVEVVNKVGLEPSKVDSLLKSFAGYFGEAKQIAESARKIQVTDESQLEIMVEARTARLKLKNIRVEAEKTRVSLKEQSLRESRAIDGISNLIKAIIVPVEEYLERQEKFAQIKEAERIEKRLNDRLEALMPYVEEISVFNLKDMEDEAFNKLLQSSKVAYKAQKDAEELAEKERIEREKLEREEQERIRIENEKLRKEAEEREKKIAEEKRVTEEKLAKEREEQQKILDEEKKKREELENKVRKENEERERLEAEKKLAEETRLIAEEEAKRKALLAPDKEKLIDLAGVIEKLQMPNVSSREAGIIIDQVKIKLHEVSQLLIEKAKTL